ncbi:14434_t:CDS:2 [Entrophospora sp. SA101]|nr:14434_t:CDS:2 [Entrophospora sp. SA101]
MYQILLGGKILQEKLKIRSIKQITIRMLEYFEEFVPGFRRN